MSKRRAVFTPANATEESKADWWTLLWLFGLLSAGGLGCGIGVGLYRWGSSLFGACK